jgi:hypothetical protein
MSLSATLFRVRKDGSDELLFTTTCIPVVELVEKWVGSKNGDLTLFPEGLEDYLQDLEDALENVVSDSFDGNDRLDMIFGLSSFHRNLRKIGSNNIQYTHFTVNIG